MALTSPRAATISAGLGIGGSSDVEEDGRIFWPGLPAGSFDGYTARLTIFDPSDFRVCLVGARLSARPYFNRYTEDAIDHPRSPSAFNSVAPSSSRCSRSAGF